MKSYITASCRVLAIFLLVIGCKESESTSKNQRTYPSVATPIANSDATPAQETQDASPEAAAEAASLQDQALAIINKNCVSCHNPASAKGNFSTIDNVASMLASGKYLVAGNPEASLIFAKLAPFGNMPPSGALKTEDTATIKQWIQSLTSTQVSPLSENQVLDLIQKDIQSNVSAADQNQVRYFSLHVPNNVGVIAGDLETMRKALFKVINSLSRSPVIIKPVAVDAKKLIYRVKLDEMGIPIAIFEAVMSDFYPFSIQHVNNVSDSASILASQNDTSLRLATGSSNYLIRADWFVATATLPLPYERLLQLGINQNALDAQLGVNVLANITANRVIRSGFRNSGMSTQNRIIERHSQVNGLSYWTSYDFTNPIASSNIFVNPLGPVTLNETKEFQHNQGEIMFQLANGMFAYRVVSNTGITLDKGAANTTNSSQGPSQFLSAMVNGVSCMSCHNAGLIHKKDEVRPFAQQNITDFSQVEFEKILNLFPEEKIFKDSLDKDNAFYLNAINQLGIDPTKPDPVNQTFKFFNRSLAKNDVREELGISTAVLDGLLSNEPFKSRWSSLRSQGAISREDLSSLLNLALEQSRIDINVALPTLGDFLVTTSCMFADPLQMDNCFVQRQP